MTQDEYNGTMCGFALAIRAVCDGKDARKLSKTRRKILKAIWESREAFIRTHSAPNESPAQWELRDDYRSGRLCRDCARVAPPYAIQCDHPKNQPQHGGTILNDPRRCGLVISPGAIGGYVACRLRRGHSGAHEGMSYDLTRLVRWQDGSKEEVIPIDEQARHKMGDEEREWFSVECPRGG